MKEPAFKLIQAVGLSGMKCQSTGTNTIHFEQAKESAIAVLNFLKDEFGQSAHFDELLKAVEATEVPVKPESSTYHELQRAKAALIDIKNWDDALDEIWDDPGSRARAALDIIHF